MSTVEAATETQRPTARPLPVVRINLMRVGFLVMFLGTVVFRWPLLPHAAELPVMEGVVLTMLTGMSLLALLGLRYPLQMLPILVFESLWKVIWLAIVALPHLIANDMSTAMEKSYANILWIIVPLAVTPWDYVWKRFVTARGDRWRR